MAVVGGGYGGIAVAKALDDVADVLLIEPRDTFVHNVAALRGLVDPEWTSSLFLPYDRLLHRGRVVRDRAVRVAADGITLGSGERISPDYVVLATGSAYPFPAKVDVCDSKAATAKLRATRAALLAADAVLLLGAGPAGLELAGEIRAAWPDKTVTIVDPAHDVVTAAGLPDEFRTEVRGQLDALGVRLLLGTSLATDPPVAPGKAMPFTVTTLSGDLISADLWFRCYGVVPESGYLAGELASARRPDGYVDVTARLNLPGQQRVFAVGDVTAVEEPKMAKAAERHAEVVAANIRALLGGGGDLVDYQPGPPGISLPLGPAGGASYAPSAGVLGAAPTSRLKGANLRVDVYRDVLNLGRSQFGELGVDGGGADL